MAVLFILTSAGSRPVTEPSTPAFCLRARALPGSGTGCQQARHCGSWAQVLDILGRPSPACSGPSLTAGAASEFQTRRKAPLIGIFFISWEPAISPSTACQHWVFGSKVALGDLYLHWPAENSVSLVRRRWEEVRAHVKPEY